MHWIIHFIPLHHIIPSSHLESLFHLYLWKSQFHILLSLFQSVELSLMNEILYCFIHLFDSVNHFVYQIDSLDQFSRTILTSNDNKLKVFDVRMNQLCDSQTSVWANWKCKWTNQWIRMNESFSWTESLKRLKYEDQKGRQTNSEILIIMWSTAPPSFLLSPECDDVMVWNSVTMDTLSFRGQKWVRLDDSVSLCMMKVNDTYL